MTFLSAVFTFLSFLGTFFLFLVASLSESEEGNLDKEILLVVSDRSQCSTKIERSPVSGLKHCDIIMALYVLGDLFASESTISDSSSC